MSDTRSQTNEAAGSSLAQAVSDERQATVLKAFADTTRLRLLRLLYNEELNVDEICRVLGLPQPRISRHLGVMRKAGLVTDHRQGTRVYYTLADLPDALEPFAVYIRQLGESDHPDLRRLEDVVRERTAKARQFADRKAAQWDDIGKVLHSTNASLLALANMVPRELTVADLGTGTGLLLPFLSSLATQVYAVDQSGAMLRRARSRCHASGLSNITFIHKPFEDLGSDLPACDALLLHFVMHQVASPLNVVECASRHLAPDGRLVIVDFIEHSDEQAKETFGSLWLGFSKDQVEGWFSQAGLQPAFWHVSSGIDPATDAPFPVFVAAAGRTRSGNADC